ncbi:hypothetical protein CERSUDRAFT_92540 [Gelatoporia subvermispora B]|uniref:Uncharacterized protein n=1 Tax=Ceriporiopsis subvermispora (strain B) TaxID=914234 RepID=M2RMH3_CERS8|nr:hypothetical protein CERSUDRAFT_92540 [Gelatoporia subvermispora B]
MSFCVLLHLQTAAEKVSYPALPFHVAQQNPRLAHLRTEGSQKERQKLQNERYKAMDAHLKSVAIYIQSLGYAAELFIPRHHWDAPKPDMWSIFGDTLPPGSGILPVGMLSPQRPVDSAWAQEFKSVINSVVHEYDCKVTNNRMMQASVISNFDIDEVKRVAKLFCLFEDVIDNLEFESELTTPDKLPAVESIRRNSVLENMDDDEVMGAIDDVQDVSQLRLLLVPFIKVPGLSFKSIYKMQFAERRSRTEILFNSHPTTACGDKVVHFMELMAKFVQYSLDHDDETIENCRPSLEVFFDEIIRNEELAHCYDPRLSRNAKADPYAPPGVVVRSIPLIATW